MNFTIQDILGACLAFVLFSVFLFVPGYILSRLTNLFQFRKRTILTRAVISTLTSIVVMPVIGFLVVYSISLPALNVLIWILFSIFIGLVIFELRKKALSEFEGYLMLTRLQRTAIFVALIWLFLVIISMVDLQWGNRLYYNVTSLDFATRVTLVDAIARTGVPPVNPSYYPGHPAFITALYYFWYILCGAVDLLGGTLVDGRMALIAGDAWCGLGLMGLIALYLKLRNNLTGELAWKTSLSGVALLTISGIDFIPALINMAATRLSYGFAWPTGDVEHWNEQITAWIGSLLWVPHHVAALIACIFAFMILFYHRNESGVLVRGASIVTAGLSLASAVGLSTWVAMVFAVFWGISALAALFRKSDTNLLLPLIGAGALSFVFAFPFLAGILAGGTGSEGTPLIIEVRRFTPIIPFENLLPENVQSLLRLALLPINYLMELGFFMIAGLLWIQEFRSGRIHQRPIIFFEMLLFTSVVVISSVFRSAIVSSNEIGWRGWLMGQFVLLIWAVDILEVYPIFDKVRKKTTEAFNTAKARYMHTLIIFAILGFTTSVVDVVLLRIWPALVDQNVAGFPNGLSPDTQLGKRTYAARIAYSFVRDQLPMDLVVQPNPEGGIDRQSGLYGTRQIAISANAPFNVPVSLLEKNVDRISEIFTVNDDRTWERIDGLCKEMFIDVLIADDLDPLWENLSLLSRQRDPLYENEYFAVFECGD